MSSSTERQFRYFLDENVQSSVAGVLRQRGREVFESRNVVGTRAKDQVVEFAAATHDLVLVTYDRDFKAVIAGVKNKNLRKAASTVWIKGDEMSSPVRLARSLDMIEGIMSHAEHYGHDIEYIQLLMEEVNVKYRVGKLDD